MPPGWKISDDGLRMQVEVKEKDFASALALLNEVGEVAEELDHHPDLHLQGYNRVRIETTSHDAGRLTARDERLAQRVQALIERRGLVP